MKVFVAGSGGYIGIPLCHQLAKEGHDVIAFDRYFFGKKPGGDRITMVVGDTRLVWADDLRGVDAVIDLAGLSNDASCELDPRYTNDINIEGAVRLADVAKTAGVKRYIYSSSASVYGHGEWTNLKEDDPVHPLTGYAHSKLAVEHHLNKMSDFHFKVVILRNATVFGLSPRMRFDLAVNAMTARALLDGSIYVMGGGDQWRPLVHIDDVVDTIVWMMNNAHDSRVSGETFNVGCGGNQMKIRTLAGRVSNVFHGVKIHTIPEDPDARSYHLSFDKLKKVRPDARFRSVEDGVWEVRAALTNGDISFTDPKTWTVNWYKQLLEWDNRLAELKLDGLLL
jgi:nucleoside-diphosphate-sugar epimerase